MIFGGFRTNAAFTPCMASETSRNYQVLTSTNLNATKQVVIGLRHYSGLGFLVANFRRPC